MRNKIEMIIFIVVCFLLCLIPFVGMTVARTDITTENKTLASLPKLREDGKLNIEYLQELGNYFEDHFAFKNLLVTADSNIQSKIFGVSNMDTVITGKNGWLYYKDTLDDYLGQNTLSDRAIYNIANNLSIIQRYVEEKGAKFLFTAAPNKNSLYGENMPYYYNKKVSDINNLALLKPQLEKAEITYADLFSQFKSQSEILYLKRDSHWNNKGAVLAYNTILDALEIDHENYESIGSVRTKDYYGDLNKMIYPLGAEPEWNYEYQYDSSFVYETDTESVEDAWIQTSNKDGEGTLLMFRDSFGNTLLPLMAEVFEKGYFSKGVPYQIESYMNDYKPDTVIVEKVERNISDFAFEPPIMTGPSVELQEKTEEISTETTIMLEECGYDAEFWEISGRIDDDYAGSNVKVYVKVISDNDTDIYEAFTVSDEDSDNGYLLYIPKDLLVTDSAQIDVLVEEDDAIYSVKSENINIQ